MLDLIATRLEQLPDRIENGVLLNFELVARFVLHVHVRTGFIVPAQKSHVCRGLRSRPVLHGDLRPGIVRLRCADLVGSVPVLQRMGVGVLLIGDGHLHVRGRHRAADLRLVGRISRNGGRGHVIRFLKFECSVVLRGERFAVLIDIVYGQLIRIAIIENLYHR